VAVFRLSLLQGFDLLGQAPDLVLHLLHQNIPLRQLFTQGSVLFSQMLIFFFGFHTVTVLDFSTLDKSLPT
jgi:hypothetical protein